MRGTKSSSLNTTKASATRDQLAAERVIAATAGRDNWQTWAGRNHGTEDFEYLDVFRGIKRAMSYNLGTKVPKPGTPCPICFCEPDQGESPSSFWHVTWCGHAVCKECLGQYAMNQVGDREQTGPLKCPVCLKTLREKDAIVAMMAGKQQQNANNNNNNDNLIKLWDVKMRNQLLRALPSFRSCPKCGGGDADGNFGGGGFVSPECLGPQHQERREHAIQILLTRNYAYAAIVLVYLLLVGTITLTKSPSPQLDLWCMLLPIYVFLKIGMAVNFLLAQRAREALFRSISVECPCCDETFVLPAESKELQDEETSRWVETNTRPCPSCSVPISKTGGCNHMRCSHCGVQFCWACMRLRTACQAYNCVNGAPYRNATFLEDPRENEHPGSRLQALQSDGSVLTYIDYILNHRVCPELKYADGLIVLACLVGRHWSVVQLLEREILSPILAYASASVSSMYVIGSVLLGLLSIAMPWVLPLVSLGLLYLGPPELQGRLGPVIRQEEFSQTVLLIVVVSLVSPSVGLSMGVGYFVNVILPVLQQQQQQQQQQRGQQQAPREQQQRGGGGQVPENQNLLALERLEQNIINEVLRRSIEDT